MSQTWHSLFIPGAEASTVAEALRALLARRGCAPYDPFPGGTGTPPELTALVRLFVAPAQDGWVRVLGDLDATLLPDLAAALKSALLAGWLEEDGGGFALVSPDGVRHEDADAFAPYLRPGATPSDLRRAFAGEVRVAPLESDAASAGLPPDLHDVAREQGVSPQQAGKLFERLSEGLFGKLADQSGESGAEQARARAVIMGGGRDPWNSLHGQRVRAIAETLALPANWRLPAWEDVRDAYHAHRMRERYPRMMALPGDRESLAAVPGIAAYLPVFMGRAQAGGTDG